VPHYNVQELRKFVQIRSPQHSSNVSNSQANRIRRSKVLRSDWHATELDESKTLTCLPRPLLQKEGRVSVFSEHGKRQERQERKKNDKRQEGNRNIEESLPEAHVHDLPPPGLLKPI
jgi:hypothetical protein